MIKQFDPQKTLFLVDGSSFLYRAYYGIRPMHTSIGIPVQAVYNFCRMIKKLIDKYGPYYLVITWDSKGKTERHELFEDYKATRQAPPRDLHEQKKHIIEFGNLIGLTQVEQPGIEADDIMYSLAKDWIQKGFGTHVVILTSDKDLSQALTNNIVLFDWFKDVVLDAHAFEEKSGFPVTKLPFYHALLGDSSDNIPGVPGIGKVGAKRLVTNFDSLQNLYDNLDRVEKDRTRKSLEENEEQAFLSEKLFLLHYHDLEVPKKKMAFDASQWPQARSFFDEFEFRSLLKDLEKYGAVPKQKTLSEREGYSFITVRDKEALDDLCRQLKAEGACALDTETDSLQSLNCNLMGVSLCLKRGTAYYVPCGHEVMEQQLDRETVLQALKPLLKDRTIKKYLHHAKFDQLVLSQYSIEICGIVFDTLIAAHLVSQDWQRIGLKYLSKFYLNEPMLNFSDAVSGNGYKHFGQVPLQLATEYAAADAHQTYQLVPILKEELEKQNMTELYNSIEFPLVSVLYKMEKEGMGLDAELLGALDLQVTNDLHVIERDIMALVGSKYEKINLNSPRQLEQLLFHDLGLPPKKKTKTGYSTDQEVLHELVALHPVPGLIIKYRELYKLKSTYLDALPGYINPKDKRIHTTFRQTAVATGRLSSSEPNLQNIPVSIKPYNVHVRSAFKAPKNHLFVSADYSQIELRVLAFLSEDVLLQKAFQEGLDIHAQTAARIFDVALEQVTSDQRQLGKRINFSILYGLTPYGLSKDLCIPFKDAQLYIEKYFAQYPRVPAWMEQVVQETKDNGFVTTYWGRRRYVPGIYESNKNLYDLARRIAINTKAQGTAAELMKKSMIELDTRLATEFSAAKMVLQIHDELLVTVEAKDADAVAARTKAVLESVVDWPVPLVVDTKIGPTWQDVTK